MQWLINKIFDKCKAYTDQAILDAKVIPSGTIILWKASTGTIPTGWTRCDGNNGTPDLRTKFVVGSGIGFPFGGTGGTTTHTHVGNSTHEHTIAVGTGLRSGLLKNDFTGPPVTPGLTGSAGTLPPYHSLVYIMKL